MDKKIYALKDGNHPGIYLSWLDFYQEIQKLKFFESRSFGYKTELKFHPANVEGSLHWALAEAKNIWTMTIPRFMEIIRIMMSRRLT